MQEGNGSSVGGGWVICRKGMGYVQEGMGHLKEGDGSSTGGEWVTCRDFIYKKKNSLFAEC